jgi:hypothetical protein
VSLLKLYNLFEAGVAHGPVGKKKPKKAHDDGHTASGLPADDDGFEGDEDDLGPDMDYEDPAPADPEEEPAVASEPEKEREPESPFTSHSERPSPALQGGKTAGSVKADKMTLNALQKALEAVRTRDDDLQDWIDDTIREIGRAIRTGSELTLPKFEATPGLDTFDDDDGGYEDED